jgi:hypothetical protein
MVAATSRGNSVRRHVCRAVLGALLAQLWLSAALAEEEPASLLMAVSPTTLSGSVESSAHWNRHGTVENSPDPWLAAIPFFASDEARLNLHSSDAVGVAVVPEPSVGALLGVCVLIIGFLWRKQ